MEMFEIESTDLGDDDELPLFEIIGLDDVHDKLIAYEEEGAYGINGVEVAALDSDAKMEPDDFNEKCLELDGVVAMEMFDIEAIDLGDDDELPVFEKIGLDGVKFKRIANEDEEAYGISKVEIALLDAD